MRFKHFKTILKGAANLNIYGFAYLIRALWCHKLSLNIQNGSAYILKSSNSDNFLMIQPILIKFASKWMFR